MSSRRKDRGDSIHVAMMQRVEEQAAKQKAYDDARDAVLNAAKKLVEVDAEITGIRAEPDRVPFPLLLGAFSKQATVIGEIKDAAKALIAAEEAMNASATD